MPLECENVGCKLSQEEKIATDSFSSSLFKGYKYYQTLSEGVLRLQEGGVMKKLHEKWWKHKRGGGACGVN